MNSSPTAEDVMATVLDLPLSEQMRLLKQLAEHLEQQVLRGTVTPSEPLSLWGICADLGPAPSADEIDEARHQLWSDFPRVDVV